MGTKKKAITKSKGINKREIKRGERGKFLPGGPGRPPGSCNITRRSVKEFVLSQVENLPKWFKNLPSDAERLDAFIRLLSYAVPKLSQIAYEDTPPISTVVVANPFDISKLSESTIKELIQKSKP